VASSLLLIGTFVVFGALAGLAIEYERQRPPAMVQSSGTQTLDYLSSERQSPDKLLLNI
jgi:hypothetical protein